MSIFVTALLETYWALDQRRAVKYEAVAQRLLGGGRGMPEGIVQRHKEKELVHYVDEGGNRISHRAHREGFDGEGGLIAVIGIYGPMFKRAGTMSESSDGIVSMQRVNAELKRAHQDPAVKGIVLDVDSPGGQVKGTLEAHRLVNEIVKDKPIVSFINELAASAAYWFICGSTEIIMNGETSEVGSIGVLLKHYNAAGFYQKMGVEVTFVTSDKAVNKVQAPDTRAMNESEIASIKAELNQLHELFEASVIEGRGGKLDANAPVFEGSVFMAEEALKLGLVDKIGTFNDAIVSAESFNFNKHLNAMSDSPEGKTAFFKELQLGIANAVKTAISGLGLKKKAAVSGEDPEAGNEPIVKVVDGDKTLTIEEVTASVMAAVEPQITAAATTNATLSKTNEGLTATNTQLTTARDAQKIRAEGLAAELVTVKGAGPIVPGPGKEGEPAVEVQPAGSGVEAGELAFMKKVKQSVG